MAESTTYMEIVSGQRRGLLASLARGSLWIISKGYGSLLVVRNAWYDSVALPKWLDVPVISVGNLTVGGTGKTPMCGWLCRQLLGRGLKPAVLSRGYKASEEGLADEMLMLSRQYPQAVLVAHPDRYGAGCVAVEHYGVQAVILDDGFQHRRIGRDLDLLLVDATRPFGFGHLLPRGLLREPLKGMARAGAVVLTRCDLAGSVQVAELEKNVRRLHPEAPVVRAVHRPRGFTGLDGAPVPMPPADRIGCLAGIARPDAFERTLADMGIRVAQIQWWPDHHCYTAADAEMIRRWAEQNKLDALITTEKDAVKLEALKVDWPLPVVALHVEIDMLDDGEAILSGLIDEVLKEHSEPETLAAKENGDLDEEHSHR
ncbi:MAG TPA: tetraacyldisaccharide 4'-kinase [Phycisphaerae bacterium]|nr:tetraacyldisaccharide 4'-kinase [Phycisphaerae bacterium]HRR85599.1 tetraacyldisaccharide 4'-kinase [Phycisphaerae bacterium]